MQEESLPDKDGEKDILHLKCISLPLLWAQMAFYVFAEENGWKE